MNNYSRNNKFPISRRNRKPKMSSEMIRKGLLLEGPGPYSPQGSDHQRTGNTEVVPELRGRSASQCSECFYKARKDTATKPTKDTPKKKL